MFVDGVLPVERFAYATDDAEAGHAFLSNAYVGYRLRLGTCREGFGLSVNRAAVDGLRADRYRHANGMGVTTEPYGFLQFILVDSGSITVIAGGAEEHWGAGQVGMFPLGVPVDLSWQDLDGQVLAMPVAALAGAVDGRGEGEVPRFLGLRPVSERAGRLWRSVFAFARRQLQAPESPLTQPLVRRETMNLLAATALSVFPNTTMTADDRPEARPMADPVVRRAAAFVEENAHRPITPAEIAAAAGVSPRTLQCAFARRGTTPTGYLRRVRLEGARRDLQAAQAQGTDGTTVRAVAARWAFAKPGRFAAAYREAYGCLPSATLHPAADPGEGR